MKVTIEEINNKQCTVIRKPFDAEWMKEQLGMWQPVRVEYRDGYCFTYTIPDGGGFELHTHLIRKHGEPINTLTILPALPKHPKPEDAPLLYRYMAEGIEVHADDSYMDEEVCFRGVARGIEKFILCGDGFINRQFEFEITHATLNGERVEIAILEKDDG